MLLAGGLLAPGLGLAGQATLHVLYYERPPFHVLRDGRVEGTLADLTRRIAADAGLSVDFEQVPTAQILNLVRQNATPFCSAGWFKTEERARFGNFSRAITRDAPRHLVTRLELGEELSALGSFKAVLANSKYTFGTINGGSYGSEADALLAQARAPVDGANSMEQNLRKLAAGRVDYLLLSDEDWQAMATSQPGLLRGVVSLRFPDIPEGQTRHFYCSLKVPTSTLEQLDTAIERLKLVP